MADRRLPPPHHHLLAIYWWTQIAGVFAAALALTLTAIRRLGALPGAA